MNTCAWCCLDLSDACGNPRFEVFTVGSQLVFVCSENCLSGEHARVARVYRELIGAGRR